MTAAGGGRLDGWQRIAGIALALGTCAFLALWALTNVRQLQAHSWDLRPGMLALSLVVQCAGLLSGAFAWQVQLRLMDTHIGFHDAARIRFVSGLARYIPGKVWPFISAARMGAPAGMSAAVTVTSMVAQTAFTLIGALVAAALFLPLEARDAGVRLETIRWMAPLLLLLAHPRIISALLALAARLTRREMLQWKGSWLQGILLVALAVFGWIVTGAALFAFISSLTPLPARAFAPVLGINALAFIAGQAFFIAPAGLGAKEGTITALLALFVSVPVAALLAIASRLWITVSELILVAILLIRPARTT